MSDGERTPEGVEPEAAERGELRHRRRQGWIESLALALLLALGIRHFLVQAYKIPSGSMIPSLLVGDQLIASKISYGIRLPFAQNKLVKFGPPERGEIVVFRFPDDPEKDFIKRAIALPGDRIRIEDGTIYLNGERVEREALGTFDYRVRGGKRSARAFREQLGGNAYRVLYGTGEYHAYEDVPARTLGPDEIFVMGDNRDHSNDSRSWGPVDLDLLEGKPLFVHFSWNHYDPGIRWHRIGTGLN